MTKDDFTYTSFRQSFTLLEKVNAEKIAAKMEHGVLKIELPKKEVAFDIFLYSLIHRIFRKYL